MNLGLMIVFVWQFKQIMHRYVQNLGQGERQNGRRDKDVVFDRIDGFARNICQLVQIRLGQAFGFSNFGDVDDQFHPRPIAS